NQFKNMQEALVRTLNLAKKAAHTEVSADLFETTSEKSLFEQYQTAIDDYKTANNRQNTAVALAEFSKLADSIHDFFDHNMVMAEEEQIRNNRLALVNNIAILIKDFADLSVIEWKQHF